MDIAEKLIFLADNGYELVETNIYKLINTKQDTIISFDTLEECMDYLHKADILQ